MTPDPRLVPVHARMARAVAGGNDRTRALYDLMRYHLGWADDVGRPVDRRAGKGLRPLLALLACEAVGGDPARAHPVAAAIELTHEFSLIHDDIQDDDRTRRGLPALWTLCGAAQGINVGDAMFAVARREIGATPGDAALVAELHSRYDRACLTLVEGQFLDLSFESVDRIDVAAYLDMVGRKTGALIGAAAAMGARAGGAGAAAADELTRFGEALGVAFQVQDDVLGLWGDPARTGKPVGADLLRRKKSLPVLMAWHDPALAADVDRLFAAPDPRPEDAGALADRMAAAGCRARAAETAREHGDAALEILGRLTLVDRPRAELAAFVARAIERDR